MALDFNITVDQAVEAVFWHVQEAMTKHGLEPGEQFWLDLGGLTTRIRCVAELDALEKAMVSPDQYRRYVAHVIHRDPTRSGSSAGRAADS